MEIGLPEQTGGHRAPWPPRLAPLAQRPFVEPVGAAQASGDRDLQAEIGGGPDVRPPEREEQINFGAPPADALNLAQRREGRLILGRGEPVEVEIAGGDGCGKAPGIFPLLAAEAAPAQTAFVKGKKALR